MLPTAPPPVHLLHPARAELLSQQHHSTMPRVKERSNLAQEVREQRYAKALKGLEDGTYKTLSEVVVSKKLSKSSLGHRRNGRRSRQEAHQDEQTFSPAAEKAVVKWIPNLDDYGFSPKVDNLMGLVNISLRGGYLAAGSKKSRTGNLIGKNWITRFLNRHLNLAIKLVELADNAPMQGSPCTLMTTHFTRLGKIIRWFSPHAITNIDEKGFLMGLSPRTCVITQRGKKNPR